MNDRKQQTVEILNYWKTIEFLSQTNLTPQSNESKKLLRRIAEKGERPACKKLEIFHNIDGSFDVKEMLAEDRATYGFMPVLGQECFFCMGKVLRNELVEHLEKYIPDTALLPELAYGDKEAIAWFTFKTDMKGEYVKNSFKLSPLLWALREWDNGRADISHDFSFDIGSYNEAVGGIAESLENYEEDYGEINTADFLQDIFDIIYEEYVEPFFPGLESSMKHLGFCEYNRYKSPADKDKDRDPTDYTDMGRSFYSSDIDRLIALIESNSFGGSEYEQSVINFILAASGQDIKTVRTAISPECPPEESLRFFTDILHIRHAPNGKWPAWFMPALMQQTAVNIAIDKNGRTPVFSVNGPPGTGKTTLLKEILADRIVERAFLLAQKAEDDPDSVFEECHFRRGPLEKLGNAYVKAAPNYYRFKYDKINDYGILVTSCNNSAVENITLDLPKAADVMSALDPSKIEDEEVRKDIEKGVEDIRRIFDVSLSEDIETVEAVDEKTGQTSEKQVRDIFFTRYADALMPGIGCWGLISAPLGRRENVKRYCTSVLSAFLRDYSSSEKRMEHLEKYRRRRREFLEQYKYVMELKNETAELCKRCAGDPDGFRLPPEYTAGDNKITAVDRAFINGYISKDEKTSTENQLSNPWASAKFSRAREKLFYCALKLHKEFAAASEGMRQNMINLTAAWNMCEDAAARMAYEDRVTAFPVLLQSLFLLTPVISTTFASVQNFLGDVKDKGVIGTLIVDEAGQAQPQEAIGALYRCRKAVIVGDPKQIEPVVTAESDMLRQLFTSPLLKGYKDKKLSVQGFADFLNPYGTYLGQGEEREWVGCPLVVHRRCADPMYSISNELSYDNTMKNQYRTPDTKKPYILPVSCWINVRGSEEGNKNHYVGAQGQAVLRLLEIAFKKTDGLPKLYIISPFTSVKNGVTREIRESALYKSEPRVKAWLAGKNIGTVHTFQGKGTDEVIFLLGCDETSASAASWVNKNIVNVAATRAKQRFYVIGDRTVWKGCRPVMTARRIMARDISAEDIEGLAKGKADETSGEVAVSASQVCPLCGKGLVLRKGPKGEFFGCSGFPKCRFTKQAGSMADAADTGEAAPEKVYEKPAGNSADICPLCGNGLVLRKSTRGEFFGCSGFPKCRFTKSL